MASFVLSTIVFFVAAFFLNRFLDEQGIGKGMTRGVLVFVLASVAAFGVSSLANLFDHTHPEPIKPIVASNVLDGAQKQAAGTGLFSSR